MLHSHSTRVTLTRDSTSNAAVSFSCIETDSQHLNTRECVHMAHVCLHTPLCANTRETVFTYSRVLTHTLSVLTRLILTHPHFVLILAQYASMPFFVSTHIILVPDAFTQLTDAHTCLSADDVRDPADANLTPT